MPFTSKHPSPHERGSSHKSHQTHYTQHSGWYGTSIAADGTKYVTPTPRATSELLQPPPPTVAKRAPAPTTGRDSRDPYAATPEISASYSTSNPLHWQPPPQTAAKRATALTTGRNSRGPYAAATPEIPASYSTSNPLQPPSPPQTVVKRAIAPTTDGACDSGDPYNSSRSIKRPRHHYSAIPDENTRAESSAVSEAQKVPPMHGLDFGIVAPPPRMYGATTPIPARLPRVRLPLPGRSALHSRGPVPRVAINLPISCGQGSGIPGFTHESTGRLQPSTARYQPPQPNAPGPALSAGPSRTLAEPGSSRAVYDVERPLRQMARSPFPSPRVPPVAMQPPQPGLGLGMHLGSQLAYPLHQPAQMTGIPSFEGYISPGDSYHVAENSAVHHPLDSAVPSGRPDARTDTHPPVLDDSQDIDNVVSDIKTQLARGFLSDLAPVVAPYRDDSSEVLPEEFWEHVVLFVSDTNGGLSPELSDIVERCREHRCKLTSA